MRCIAGTLVGLEHVIGPAILFREAQVGVQQVALRSVGVDNRRVGDIGIGPACRNGDSPCAVIAAFERRGIGIAHLFEAPVRVLGQCAAIHGSGPQRDGNRRAALIGDAAGGDVVATRSDRRRCARIQARRIRRNGASRRQVVKKIVGRAILLHDDDNVLDLGRKLG